MAAAASAAGKLGQNILPFIDEQSLRRAARPVNSAHRPVFEAETGVSASAYDVRIDDHLDSSVLATRRRATFLARASSRILACSAATSQSLRSIASVKPGS